MLSSETNDSLTSTALLHPTQALRAVLAPPLMPKLRTEVSLDGTALRDGLTGNIFPLNGIALKTVAVMDGQISVHGVLANVARECAIDPIHVERELRQLLLLGLLEGACDSYRKRFRQIREGELPPQAVLAGSRFGCQGSGACCRGYVFGPVSEKEKARIEAREPAKVMPHLANQPLFVKARSNGGKPVYQLATSGDACVFLEQGLTCGLHRAFGPTAKPALCQLYPLAALTTIEGLKVYDRGECATFAQSAATGDLLEDTVEKVRKLVDDQIYHPVVRLDKSWRCDYGMALALAARLDEEACFHPPLQALQAIGQVTRTWILALTQCPIEAGQPVAAVAGVLDRRASPFGSTVAGVVPNTTFGLGRLASLAEELVENLAPTESMAASFTGAASLVSEVCRNLLSEQPMSRRARAATALPLQTDAEAALTLSLRHMLFGHELLMDDHLPAGLLRMALVLLLAIAGARLRALDEGAGAVSAGHLSFAHMVAKRKLNRHEPYLILRTSGEQAWPILDALPQLAQKLS